MAFFPLTRGLRLGGGGENAGGAGIGGWAIVTILFLLLIGAGGVAYFGWTISSVDVPISGYVAMAFGVIFPLRSALA